MKGLKTRWFVVIATFVFSIYLLIPTYLRFAHGEYVQAKPKPEDPWYHRFLPTQSLKLGLDLQGGVHLVLGIDFADVYKDAVLKFKTSLEDIGKEEKISGVTTELDGLDKIKITYPSLDAWGKIETILRRNFSEMYDFASQNDKQAVLVLSEFYRKQVHDRAVEQALETLRNRIDEFGIAEPIIQRHGEDKILVQFPGVKDINRLKNIIARTAKLEFKIVKAGPELSEVFPTKEEIENWIGDFLKSKQIKLTSENPISRYSREFNATIQSKLPKGTEVLFSRKTDPNTKEVSYIPYVLDIEPIVAGDELEDAYYGFKPDTNEPIVNFSLNPTGSSRFEKATGEHVGGYMAIVLDGNVHSAPRINQKIGGGRAIIEMGRMGRDSQHVLEDAKDTALVLRSGALPARLEFLEERTVGPSLGQDSIRAGTEAFLVALILVAGFMVIYYKFSGFIACLALAFEGIIILAGMAAFEGTLTLPGLAGITLTLGMSIDANVLIFEHVREELRTGKTAAMAIAEGYRRASNAILDANVTGVIAALVLMGFGYGPIRGFAVTLIIGLIASQYTAVFVTRVIFDQLIVAKGKKTVSI